MENAEKIQQFHAICLLNCLYKWFTKVLTLRLEPIANKIIHREQTTFIKCRNIMTGVLALHEVLHETKIKKSVGIVLKLDFEKEYDKVNWDFLFACMEARGFNETWCQWVKKVVCEGTCEVK